MAVLHFLQSRHFVLIFPKEEKWLPHNATAVCKGCFCRAFL